MSRLQRSGWIAFEWRGLAVPLLLLLSVLGSPNEATAAEEESAAPSYGYALAHELMSPFCPGRTLAACTSGQAAELRQWILLQEAAGATREEVIAVIEGRYGDIVKSAPSAGGWGLAARLLPATALIVGALLVWVILRRMVAPRSRPAASRSRPGETASTPSAEGDSSASGDEDSELERLVDAEFAAGER